MRPIGRRKKPVELDQEQLKALTNYTLRTKIIEVVDPHTGKKVKVATPVKVYPLRTITPPTGPMASTAAWNKNPTVRRRKHARDD